MRKFVVGTSEDPVTSDIFFTLQLRTVNEPLFPKLETFECERVTGAFIPFVPSLPSCKTTEIDIGFDEDLSTVMAGSMITKLPTLCPDLEHITLIRLPRDLVITAAVSNLLLTCNRNVVQWFCVDSPSTEEAHEVVFQLPNLSHLWVVIQGHTLLPPVALPSLITIVI